MARFAHFGHRVAVLDGRNLDGRRYNVYRYAPRHGRRAFNGFPKYSYRRHSGRNYPAGLGGHDSAESRQYGADDEYSNPRHSREYELCKVPRLRQKDFRFR